MIHRFIFFIVMLILATNQAESAEMASNLMQSSAATTKAEVLKHIPIGTVIEQAKAFMEANGFKCLAKQNQRFAEDGPLPNQQINHGPADTLWCDSGERTFRLVLTRRRQIIFVNVEGRVSYVAVSTGVTGP